jgi:predicted DNA-binding transcriptional regulator AlpA
MVSNPREWLRARDLIASGRASNWSDIRRKVAAGYLPAPVKLSAAMVAWRKSELDEYDAKLQRVHYSDGLKTPEAASES